MRIFFLFISIIPLIGAATVPYYFHRSRLLTLSRDGMALNPFKLFLHSLRGMVAWVLMPIVISAIISLALADVALVLVVCMYLAAGLAGFIVLITMTVQWLTELKERRAVLEQRAKTKFQIWMQDIFIGTFAAGLSLTLQNLYAQAFKSAQYSGSNRILSWQITAIVVQMFCLACAFLITLDVLRYMPEAQNPRKRGLLMAAMMLLTLVPTALYFEITAWMGFKYALSKTAVWPERVPEKLGE